MEEYREALLIDFTDELLVKVLTLQSAQNDTTRVKLGDKEYTDADIEVFVNNIREWVKANDGILPESTVIRPPAMRTSTKLTIALVISAVCLLSFASISNSPEVAVFFCVICFVLAVMRNHAKKQEDVGL